MSDHESLIFLDMDGVLNRHDFDAVCQSTTIDRECVTNLNLVLDAVPDALIVISSAWRYMVINKAMTLKGFEYLLRTHGVHCVDRLIGVTCPDEEIELRGLQIRRWMYEHGNGRRFVVFDDGGMMEGRWYDLGLNALGDVVIWCDGRVGLIENEARRAIGMLTGGPPP